MKTVIGIDPDTKTHGVAVYENGELVNLFNLTLMEIIHTIVIPHTQNASEDETLLFSIEDVQRNKFMYSRNVHKNNKVSMEIAQSVGACKQSQEELERALNHYGVKFVKFRPTKTNWAKNKKRFEQVTSWKKRSNEDTRSAAFFGYLAI